MTDEELLLQAQEGSKRALQEFWERHRASAYRLALFLSRRPHVAQEALQEAWLGLAGTLAQFDPSLGSARGWLLGIVRNQAIQAGRREGRVLRPERLQDLLPDDAESPEKSLSLREDIAAMLQALEGLAPEHREIVTLRWLLGMDDGEISQLLGLKRDAVRMRAHRGLLALRKAMGQGDP